MNPIFIVDRLQILTKGERRGRSMPVVDQVPHISVTLTRGTNGVVSTKGLRVLKCKGSHVPLRYYPYSTLSFLHPDSEKYRLGFLKNLEKRFTFSEDQIKKKVRQQDTLSPLVSHLRLLERKCLYLGS